MPTNGKNEVSGWVGWVYFAGILMVVAGIFQAVSGLTALLKDDFFVVTSQRLIAFDITTWGWVHLLLGVVVVAAGVAVVSGQMWGRVVGVTLAGLSAVANFLFITSYPVWSVIVIVIDILIIYALIVHGSEVQE